MSKFTPPTATALDKAIGKVFPGWAAGRAKSRLELAMAESYTGASKTRRSMVNWNTAGGDFDSDTLPELPHLRERSEDLYHNNMLAAGAINTKVTSIVGRGLTMQSHIDAEVLGLTEDQADAWESSAERGWFRYSESKFCTVNQKHNFREFQALSFLSALVRGDAFVITPEKAPVYGFPNKLRVQLVEADRVCNEDNGSDTATLSGGVETNSDGSLKSVHILNGHPGNYNKQSDKWTKVSFFGEKTGRRNVLHLMASIRADQSRGVPDLSPIIEGIKAFGTLTQANIDGAVIQTMLSVFIETEGGLGFEAGSTEGSQRIESNAIIELNPGEKPHFLNPTHPGSNYQQFAHEFYKQMGAALQIPYELLIKNFDISYSASQASMLEAWRFFSTRRSWLADNLCQPVYELWLAEEVSSGRISAPGFFTSPVIRAAYCGADWVGQPRGSIREDIQNKADGYAEDRGWKTSAKNSQERGGVFIQNHRQRVKEVNLRKKDGLITVPEEETAEDLATVEP